MDAVEMIVYIMVAFAVAGIVLGFLFGFDFVNVQRNIVSLFRDTSTVGFDTVTNESFMGTMIDMKTVCEETDHETNITLYMRDGDMDQDMFFDIVEKISLCNSFQSASRGCGRGEFFTNFDALSEGDVFMVACRGPKLFNISVVS
jgi:hypothetical protein